LRAELFYIHPTKEFSGWKRPYKSSSLSDAEMLSSACSTAYPAVRNTSSEIEIHASQGV
jgi:hypothetical protein